MRIFTVHVTQEDINKAVADQDSTKRTHVCPIANALSRTLGEPCTVGHAAGSRARTGYYDEIINWSDEKAIAVTKLNDEQWATVEPFSFEAFEAAPEEYIQ